MLCKLKLNKASSHGQAHGFPPTTIERYFYDTRFLSTKINYKELSNNDFEKILNQALKEGIEKYDNEEAESIKIRIVNVPSCEIEDMFGLDVTDFRDGNAIGGLIFILKEQRLMFLVVLGMQMLH